MGIIIRKWSLIDRGSYLEIPLTKCAVAKIDKEDFEKVRGYAWYLDTKGYAAACIKCGNKQFRMHRFLIDAPAGLQVDHINFDRLDNRRSNLRLCTESQNRQNRRVQANNTSGFSGVVWDASRGKWAARVKINNRHINLGRFETKEEAIAIRISNAKMLFGEFYNGPKI